MISYLNVITDYSKIPQNFSENICKSKHCIYVNKMFKSQLLFFPIEVVCSTVQSVSSKCEVVISLSQFVQLRSNCNLIQMIFSVLKICSKLQENCCWYKTIQTIFDKIVNFLSKLGRRRHHYLDLGKRTSVRCTANIWFLFWDDWNKHSNFVSLALPLRRKFKWFSLLGRQLWPGSGLRSPFFVIEKNSSHLLQISSPVQPWDNFAC